jgi:hypothetical protein
VSLELSPRWLDDARSRWYRRRVRVVLAIVALALLEALAALISSGGRARRRLGVVCAFLPLGVPFFMGPGSPPVLTFFVALTAVLATIRATDLYGVTDAWSFPRRLWHVAAGFDTRLARTVPPRVDRALLAEAARWGLLSALVLGVGWTLLERTVGWPRYLVRWAGFAAFALTMFEVVPRLVSVGYAALGVQVPPLHDRPYLSRSVAEFWGVRWNKVIGGWLRVSFHAPLARRGWPRVGLVAAFAASALLHAYLMLPGAPWPWAVVISGFFLAQALVMTVERALRVRRWAAVPARAWTVGTLLLLSPLMSEPALQYVDPTPLPAVFSIAW